jgi:hypothetical protein
VSAFEGRGPDQNTLPTSALFPRVVPLLVGHALLAPLADVPRVTKQADSLLSILPFQLVSEFSRRLLHARKLNVHNLNDFQGKLSTPILAQCWHSRIGEQHRQNHKLR